MLRKKADTARCRPEATQVAVSRNNKHGNLLKQFSCGVLSDIVRRAGSSLPSLPRQIEGPSIPPPLCPTRTAAMEKLKIGVSAYYFAFFIQR